MTFKTKDHKYQTFKDISLKFETNNEQSWFFYYAKINEQMPKHLLFNTSIKNQIFSLWHSHKKRDKSFHFKKKPKKLSQPNRILRLFYLFLHKLWNKQNFKSITNNKVSISKFIIFPKTQKIIRKAGVKKNLLKEKTLNIFLIKTIRLKQAKEVEHSIILFSILLFYNFLLLKQVHHRFLLLFI